MDEYCWNSTLVMAYRVVFYIEFYVPKADTVQVYSLNSVKLKTF
jgi:hypothetical protein